MKKILIIDDDEHLRDNLLDMLSFEGYEVFGVENGHKGILFAQEHLPDLIICDMTMPVMNGFEVIVQLREHPRTASIPVIFLSAHREQVFIRNGMQLGAMAYLPKPYSTKELLDTIQTQISD